MTKALLAAAISTVLLSGAAAAQTASPYQRLAGTWTGEQVRGGGRFAMVIEMKADGSYTWTREGRFVTGGQLSGTGSTLEYKNGAGSHGAVQVSGNRLVWKNIHTGNDYTVTVSKR